MSLTHGEETHLLKVSVGPALMIDSAPKSTTMLSIAKDRPETAADPPVCKLEDVGITVFEIDEPASQNRIE